MSSEVSPDPAWLRTATMAVLRRPRLWSIAARQLLSLAEPGWWRRSPHLPLPPPAYLRFRLVTAYGDPDRAPAPDDVVTYLRWCRDERRRAAGGSPGGACRSSRLLVGR